MIFKNLFVIRRLKKSIITHKLDNGFVSTDLICCSHCGGEIVEADTDSINYNTCECDYYCKKCNKTVGFWGYGTINPYSLYTTLPIEKVNKIISKKIDKEKKKDKSE